MKHVLEILFLKLFSYLLMNLDIFQQTFHEIRRPLEFLSSKNRIPNTYEMSAKISQNSENKIKVKRLVNQ